MALALFDPTLKPLPKSLITHCISQDSLDELKQRKTAFKRGGTQTLSFIKLFASYQEYAESEGLIFQILRREHVIFSFRAYFCCISFL